MKTLKPLFVFTLFVFLTSCIVKRPGDADEKKEMFLENFHESFHDIGFLLTLNSNRGVATTIMFEEKSDQVTNLQIEKAENAMLIKNWKLIRKKNGFSLFCKEGAIFELAEPSPSKDYVEGGYFLVRIPDTWIVGYKYHPDTIEFCNQTH